MKKHLLIASLVVLCLPNLAFSVTPDISAGGDHVLALKENGEVWGWGANDYKQLGRNTSEIYVPTRGTYVNEPILVPAGRTGVQVAGGERHSLVLLDDNTVLSFGRNNEGQLGTGRNQKLEENGENPSVISGLTDITAIAAGGSHSIALKKDGSVWTFGSNNHGQLGDGTKVNRLTPVQVPELSDIIAISAGANNSYALNKDGIVFEWGDKYPAQYVKVGSKNLQILVVNTSPVQVNHLSGITAIAAGGWHASALRNDGTIWSWGRNFEGQLGNNTNNIGVSQPQQAQGINNAVKITCGTNHTVVIRSDGSMWTFGNNTNGQLGFEKIRKASVPQASVLTKDVVNVAAGGGTTFALKRDGTISVFGSAKYGQMGDGRHMTSMPSPVQVYEETKASKVSCGASHSALRRRDGTVGWIGTYKPHYYSNDAAQRSLDEQSYQLKVLSTLGNIIQVASGDHHTVMLKSDGTVWAYGNGDKGQLGDGKNTTSMIPVQVSGITDVISVAAGGSSSLAVKGDGTVLTWGDNSSSQLGDGTTTNRASPVTVAGLTRITTAAMGKKHAIARQENETAWIWGSGTDITATPKQVQNLTDVETVAAGEGFSLALLADKSVSAWGINGNGQLGLGDKEFREKPTLIPGLEDVLQIAVGSSHAIARLKDGTIKAWGKNDCGQLGDGTYSNRLSPVVVQGLTGITDITAGKSHSIAVRNDATAWSWGSNEKEQLGVSATRQHRSAIRLITDKTDTDSDGMPDELERTYFGDLSHTGTADSDGDGWTDIREILFETNPTLADTDSDNLTDIADSSTSLDLDKDGMADAWERRHFGNISVAPDADADGDGISNLQEYQQGTSPVRLASEGKEISIILNSPEEEGSQEGGEHPDISVLFPSEDAVF